jgi:tRNA G18 (ribose-2'-O)-methylase SpoU
VRSVYNVGSVFRSADGAGVDHLYLCGITPTPEHRRLVKTALGAETEVPWSHHANGYDQARRLRDDGVELLALEVCRDATAIYEYAPSLSGGPLCLVLGNEVAGIDPGIVDVCNHILQIPMYGLKRTLNAAVAFGIAVYWLRWHSL